MAMAVAQRLEQLATKAGLKYGSDGSQLLDQLRDGKEPRLVKKLDGLTLVHFSCRHGWLDFVKSLIQDHNCDPNAETDNGRTPVHYACLFGHIDIVHYLASEQYCNPDCCDKDQQTPLHYIFRMDCTVEKKLEMVIFLVTTVKCDVNKRDKNGNTALILACKHGSAKIAHYLVSAGHCDVIVCNNNGDTALLMVCRLGYFLEEKEVVALLLEAGCDPTRKNNCGNIPLNLACRSENFEVVKLLVRDRRCNPHEKNIEGDTALHIACRLNQGSDISKLLLEEAKINPSSVNDDGDTPLHFACKRKNFKVVKLLLSDQRCNPCIKNTKGDTALHVACRYKRTHNIAKLLLEGAKINPNAKNNDGDTPLHLACKSDNFKLVQLLVRDQRCNPHEKNSEANTALHVTCLYKRTHNIAKLLLEEAKINPNAKNNIGDTPLHLACKCENFQVVKFLVGDHRCNPHEKNSKGDTTLHVACRHNQTGDISKFLLQEIKINPNAKNNDGQIPLELTSDPSTIRELIRHGANPQDVYKTHGKVLGKHSSKQPPHTPVKLFMVGNPSAGKSTLTKALKEETSGLKRLKTRIVKVSGVDEKTAGIAPHEFESKTYGYVTLYDFAGQREFYGGHAALLQNAIQTSAPIFLIVVDLSESTDNIKLNIFYWLSFLENQYTSVNSKPHFVVIGSHADILKSRGEDPKHKASFITSLLTTPQFSSLEFTGFVAMDCQYADSAGMRELHQVLKTSCDSLRTQESINFNAHCFLVYLLDKFRDSTAVTIHQIQMIIAYHNESDVIDITTFLPKSTRECVEICDQLNDRGHLLVLKNLTTVENSWVIIDRTALLAEVNGTIFAPKGFKEHIKLASSTGVVPLSNIAKYFPKHDLTMLVGFLSHLEFCHEISDQEILGLISQEQVSTARKATGVQGERYFFFPGLVTLEVPSKVWEPQPQFDYHCGWILQCSRPEQFFDPRFLQVLLLRLAFSFAFTKHASADVPSLQRRCSIWKNGIYWGNRYGVETLVEVTDQNRVVVLMRCPEVKSECLQLRSLLIQKVLAAAREFCHKVSTVESFINPSDTTQYPLKPISQLTLYDVTEVATAVAEGMPSVVNDAGKPVSLDSLLSFEPYADLGEPILHELFNEDSPTFKKMISNRFIYDIAERILKKKEMIKELFKPNPTQLAERMSKAAFVNDEHEIIRILDIWKDTSEGTYQCLQEKLDQFSVFAGRNPLVLRN